MLINEHVKTIFLHNPKCGGTFFRDTYSSNTKTNKGREYFQLYQKELNTDTGHINLMNLPRFVPDYQDYRIISFIRNPYNRFISALYSSRNKSEKVMEIVKKYNGDIHSICEYILSLDFYNQDRLIRNLAIPWLNPQSYYINSSVIRLQYESETDWNFILTLFNIENYDLQIKKDYEIKEETKFLIRLIYFDDEEIFRLYDQI